LRNITSGDLTAAPRDMEFVAGLLLQIDNDAEGRRHGAAALSRVRRRGRRGHDENQLYGYRFPLEIIQKAIWLSIRFTLSLRDVEDVLAERGIVVS